MSELMTVKDVATVLKVSEDTVVRRFAKVKGVIDLGVSETRHRRRYRILRIPVAVVEKHLAELSGRAVSIEVPERAERRRKSPRGKTGQFGISRRQVCRMVSPSTIKRPIGELPSGHAC